jgi:hypothetical protein
MMRQMIDTFRRNPERRGAARWVASAFVLAMAASVLAPSQAAAQGKGGKTPPPPLVSAEFRSSVPGAYPGDKLAGDGTAYPPYNGSEGASINPNGGLTIILQTGASPDRTMWFDFSTPSVDYGSCNRPTWLGTGVASRHLSLQMNDGTSTTALGLLQLAIGSAYSGFGKINFYSGVTGDPYFWTLRFPPNSLTVTRLSATQWTIEWTPGNNSTYATLQCTTNKRPTVIADDSEWQMPFKIVVNQVQ